MRSTTYSYLVRSKNFSFLPASSWLFPDSRLLFPTMQINRVLTVESDHIQGTFIIISHAILLPEDVLQ